MKVGLAVLQPEIIIKEATFAEESGFDYLASGEHLFFHGAVPNAFISLAAAAGATSEIRLVTSVALPPLYPAALFAKLVASLDSVSGGRLELGVGAGGEYPAEFDAVGVELSTRFRRIEETLTVCRLLNTGEMVSFEGEFTHLHNVQLNPLPVQLPMPPLWLPGRKSGALRRVGRLADVWLPYMVTPEMLRSGLDEISTEAALHGRPEHSVGASIFAWTCVDGDGTWAQQTGLEAVGNIYNQDFSKLADKYLFLGTPGKVLSRLSEFASAGADKVIIAVAAKPEDRPRVLNTIAKELLPGLHEVASQPN
jgi:alkanesulfonate monooxygenase SsuD/methylene tetrahydromethanopterin reductase-like flavin-dependent oxidoreductase (luciferase family)